MAQTGKSPEDQNQGKGHLAETTNSISLRPSWILSRQGGDFNLSVLYCLSFSKLLLHNAGTQ